MFPLLSIELKKKQISIKFFFCVAYLNLQLGGDIFSFVLSSMRNTFLPPATRGGRFASLDASFARCFAFEEHRQKH